MVKKEEMGGLSRRERQIMDAVYRAGEATANDILNDIPDPPTINAVRRLISILEEKGHLRHKWVGPRHVYMPTVPRGTAAGFAMDHLKKTFFGGSALEAMAAMFDRSSQDLSVEEIDALSRMIEKAKQEGR